MRRLCSGSIAVIWLSVLACPGSDEDPDASYDGAVGDAALSDRHSAADLTPVDGQLADSFIVDPWNTAVVDHDVDHFPSLAMDNGNRPRVAYRRVASGELMYASFDGSSWQTEVVSANEQVGQYLVLVLDSSDQPVIAYTGRRSAAEHEIKLARKSGNAWSQQVVDSSAWVKPSIDLRLDNNDSAHVAYIDISNNAVTYAHWDGQRFARSVVERIEQGPDPTDGGTSAGASFGSNVSLALNDANLPRISYARSFGNHDYRMYFGIFDGSVWSIQDGDATYGVLEWSDLDTRADGVVTLVYFDNENQNIVYRTHNGNVWIDRQSVAGVGTAGSFPALVKSNTAQPCLSYADLRTNTLFFAQLNGSWTSEVLGEASYGALAIDANRRVFVAYRQSTTGALRVGGR